MKYANSRDFTLNTVKYLKSKEEVCVSRRGKPIGLYYPLPALSPENALLELRKILDESNVNKKELIDMFEKSMKKVYKS